MREIVEGESPHRSARSRCRQPRFTADDPDRRPEPHVIHPGECGFGRSTTDYQSVDSLLAELASRDTYGINGPQDLGICELIRLGVQLVPRPASGPAITVLGRELCHPASRTANCTPVRYDDGGKPVQNPDLARGNATTLAWTTTPRAWTIQPGTWTRHEMLETTTSSAPRHEATTTSCV
jgi:hypothetical protein